MHEIHKHEQYFYDPTTLDHLARFMESWSSPCCVCAPMLGKHVADRGGKVTILDIDERFTGTKGFQKYDIYRPTWLGTSFDLIVCDPPFFNASLSDLFAAIRTLSLNNFQQPMLISYLSRRADAIVGTFSKFNLAPTGYFPNYQTVQDVGRNKIEMFSNLNSEQLETLNDE